MKIVMLGHSGVGKTTYMTSLYGAMQSSLAGLTLKTMEKDDHNQLLDIAKKIHRGEYPPPTAVRSEYEFLLRYKAEVVTNFRWSDYRGIALTESQESEEARLLIQDLSKADGLILFCDSSQITNRHAPLGEIRRISYLVGQALSSINKPFSLAIVLTKADLIEGIGEDTLSYFGGLIDTIAINKHVLGTLIPIACGRKMVNTSLPLLFALTAGVKNTAEDVRYEADENNSQANRLERQSGMWDDFWSSVFGVPTNRQLSRNRRVKAQEKTTHLIKILDTLQAMNKFLKDLPAIEAGKTQKDYLLQLGKLKKGTELDSNYQSYLNDPFSNFKN